MRQIGWVGKLESDDPVEVAGDIEPSNSDAMFREIGDPSAPFRPISLTSP